MNLILSHGCPLKGTIHVPGDKSLSHRAALFASLADGESRVENFLVSGVTRVMLDALAEMGVDWHLEGTTLVVKGQGLRGLRVTKRVLNCGNSATTLRMLAGAMAAANVQGVLDGSAGLRRRPMERIVTPLRMMGVAIESLDGCAPLTLGRSSYPLKALEYALPVASAQVKTCLLLAALAADGPSTLIEAGPSRDHTERMLRSMGVSVSSERVSHNGRPQYHTRLQPPCPLSLLPLVLELPGDFSSAAFLIVAALVTPGSEITIRGVGLNSARTGLLDALLAMGGDIRISAQSNRHGEPAGDLTVRNSELHGIIVRGEEVVRMIDEFPVFAVAAACADGETVVRDAAELRHKESDRIGTLRQELTALGVEMREEEDGFTINGGRPVQGGEVDPHGDHRLAMALAVAGMAARSPVTIREAQIIDESFPGFASLCRSLGADMREEVLEGEAG